MIDTKYRNRCNFLQKGITTGLFLMKIEPALVEIYPLSAVTWWLIVIYPHIIPTW